MTDLIDDRRGAADPGGTGIGADDGDGATTTDTTAWADGATVAVLGAAVVGYAAWTIGFHASLLIDGGPGQALLFAAPVTVAAVLPLRKPLADGIRGLGRGVGIEPGSAQAWIIFAALIGTEVLRRQADSARLRAVLAIVVAAAFVEAGRRLVVDRDRTSSIGWLAAGALLIAAAWIQYVSWWTFFVFLTVGTVLAIGLLWREPRTAPSVGPAVTAPVLLSSCVLGSYALFNRNFNLDDAYYLNKAQIFSQDWWSYSHQDGMYGIDGAPHLPPADLLSSFEPLSGMLGAASGLNPATWMYLVLAPTFAFLVPAASALAAKGLGSSRPDVAAMAAVALIGVGGQISESGFFWGKIFQGKGLMLLVLLPFGIFALTRFLAAPTGLSYGLLTAVSIAMVGATPSGALALVPMHAAVIAAVLVDRRPWRAGSARHWFATPAVALTTMAYPALVLLAGRELESRSTVTSSELLGRGLLDFSDPRRAWAYRSLSELFEPDRIMAAFVLAGALAALVLSSSSLSRWYFALGLLGTFTLLLNPLTFDPIIDTLKINNVAWRFGWGLPLALAFGMAVEGAADAGRLRWIGGGLLGVLLVFGQPITTRGSLGAPAWDAPQDALESARAIDRFTPEGGRYVAALQVSGVTTMFFTSVHAANVRNEYTVILDSELGESFLRTDRLIIDAGVQLDREFSDEQYAASLERVDISTVCVDPAVADPDFMVAVARTYSRVEAAPSCDIWVRDRS